MIDTDGDISKRTLQISDLITNNNSNQIALDGSSLILSSMNATAGQFLSFNNDSWVPTTINVGSLFTFTNSLFDLKTDNLNENSTLRFYNGEWQALPIISSNSLFILDENGIQFSTQNVSNGDLFIYKNNHWETMLLLYDQFDITDVGIRLASQNAVIGQQLTWTGLEWVPSDNANLTLMGSNGIKLLIIQFSYRII